MKNITEIKNKMVLGLYGQKMEPKGVQHITKMGKGMVFLQNMVFGLGGIKMETNNGKNLTKMEKKMVLVLHGQKMETKGV